MYSKEHPTAPSSLVPSVQWWSALGSQLYGEPFGPMKSLSVDHLTYGDQLTDAPWQAQRGTNQGPQKESHTNSQFTMYPGDGKDFLNVQKAYQHLQPTVTRQSYPSEYKACFELGLGQPLISANYPNVNQCYGVFASYGAQATGRIMLPLNVKTAEDGPIFVNAKQYRGIMRRRQSRAKAELANRMIKARKPYMHESRHLHAMRRERGSGGRFLTKKEKHGKSGAEKAKAGSRQLSQQSRSPSSEVVHLDSRNMSSPKETYGGRSNISGSEVTSMYSRFDLDFFQIDHLRPSAFHSLSNVMDSGQIIGMSNKWVTAADGCCDFLKV